MFTATIDNLDEFTRDWRAALSVLVVGTQVGVELGAKEGTAEALATRGWKDRTGETRANTRSYLEARTALGATAIMEQTVDHASFLDEGSVPHEIRPRRPGGFLRWEDDNGDVHFAKRVWHPGWRGDGAWGRAAEKAERVVLREVEIAVGVAQHRFFEE